MSPVEWKEGEREGETERERWREGEGERERWRERKRDNISLTSFLLRW